MLNFLSRAPFSEFHVETTTKGIGRKKPGLGSPHSMIRLRLLLRLPLRLLTLNDIYRND